MVGRIPVDLGPGACQGIAFDVRFGGRRPPRGLTDIEAPTAQQQNRLRLRLGLAEDCGELANDLGW